MLLHVANPDSMLPTVRKVDYDAHVYARELDEREAMREYLRTAKAPPMLFPPPVPLPLADRASRIAARLTAYAMVVGGAFVPVAYVAMEVFW